MSQTGQADRNRGRNRTRNASAMKLNFDRLEDRSLNRYPFHYLGGVRAWSGPRAGECPVCLGRMLRRKEYCLYCDRCGLDGLAQFPGFKVGSCINPNYRTDPPAFTPDPRLKGGRSGKFRAKPAGATKARRRRA